MLPRRVRLLFGSLALSLGLVVAAELALRAGGFAERTSRFAFESAFPNLVSDRLLVADDARLFTLATGFRAADAHLGRYASDGWPFRGRPAEPAPPGLARVAVFGDSCVFGTGLDAADTLPWRLQEELAARGFPPTAVAVANYGVPGYSSVQIERLLAERLAAAPPDVAVFYPAAWNDQAPALGADDATLVARADGRSALARAFRRTALWGALRALAPRPELAPDELARVQSAFERGELVSGARVAPEETERRVRRMLALCRAHGVVPVVVAPAHPAETARRHPRTRADAATVLRVATEERAARLDAQALLAQTGRDEAFLFLDWVHPTPEAVRALAPPLAELVAAALPPPSVDPLPLAIVAVAPASGSALGDLDVVVELDRDLGADVPAIVVGGAPLVGVRALGAHRYAGRLGANAAGPRTLVVQARGGCASRTDALTLVAPSLLVRTHENVLEVRSRPGDRARVAVSTAAADAPTWTPEGARLLATDALLPETFEVLCGADGVGRAPLPESAARASGTFFLQALVEPAGLPRGAGGGRWTPLARWERDP